MPHTLEEVRGYALQLTADERELLGDELLDSIRSEEDRRLDLAYTDELRRRIAEIDSGTAELVDADEAIASARQALVDTRQTTPRR